MVFMIRVPPAPNMNPPHSSHSPKDDRVSLMKSIHRPYSQMDNSTAQYGHEYGGEHRGSDAFGGRANCHRQQWIVGTAIMAGAGLVLFVLFVTTFRKIPTEDPFVKMEEMLGLEERPSPPDGVAVKTNCGHHIGKVEDGAYVFKGIAYAKPPVGNLRWRKPVPLWVDSEWCEQHRTQEAFHFGDKCFQLNPYTKNFEGSEDCLFLNVWTPSLDSSKGGLEVMVFVHGGFLQFGSGHQSGLRPSAQLAKTMNVVFVSLNYRLYTLGFLALDLLTDDMLTDARGNYGLWDQLCALQWVKDNIRNFGGDPRKVTVFGADAGAASLLALSSSAKARGLFRAAWLLGPTALFSRSFDEAATRAHATLLPRSGCTTAACLRAAKAEAVAAAHLGRDDASFRIRDQNDLPIQGIFPEQLIVVDGELIKHTPTFSSNGTKTKSIPLLIGTASQAVEFWPGPDDLGNWTWSQYKKYVTTSLDSFGLPVSKMALTIYNGTAMQAINPEVTAEYLYTTMVSDIRQSCPVSEMAKQLASVSQHPVYRYTLTARPSSPVTLFNYKPKYSFHMWDMIAFFGEIQHFLEDPQPEDIALGEVIQETVRNFVKSGGQNVGDSNWLRFPKKIANLAVNITFGDVNKSECKFWSKSGLGVYAWVS